MKVSVAIFLPLLTLPFACDQPNTPRASAKSCGQYAKALCEATGNGTPVCDNNRTWLEYLPPSVCAAGLTDVAFSKRKQIEKRKVCTDLADKFCKDIGPETKTCKDLVVEMAVAEHTLCETRSNNYDTLLSLYRDLEAQKKPLTQKQQAAIAADVTTEFGPKDAKVTIVEFTDFESRGAAEAAEVVAKIKEKYPKEVRLVFRHYSKGRSGERGNLAYQAALAAGAQGKFFEFYNLLCQNSSALERKGWESHAEKLGLNMDKFKKALDEKQFAAAVDADIKLAKSVAATLVSPTMFINRNWSQNPKDFNVVSGEIDRALKETR